MERQWSAREQHRAAVLSLLHRGHVLTRGEIADRLGLTRSTVSEVLTTLRNRGAGQAQPVCDLAPRQLVGEIADRLGLTRSTVSEVLTTLRGDGILAVSRSRPPGGRGRPAEVLRIHPGAVRDRKSVV